MYKVHSFTKKRLAFILLSSLTFLLVVLFFVTSREYASRSTPINDSRRDLPLREYVLVIGAESASYPLVLTENGLVPLINKTQYQSGPEAVYPLYSCSLPESALMKEGDSLLVKCQVTELGGVTKDFLVVPTENELHDYNGEPLAHMSWHGVFFGEYNSTPFASHGLCYQGTFTEVPAGMYYFTCEKNGALYFISTEDIKSEKWEHLSHEIARSFQFKLIDSYAR